MISSNCWLGFLGLFVGFFYANFQFYLFYNSFCCLTFQSCIRLGLCHIILYVRWTSTSRRWSIGMAFLNCKLSTDYSNEFANTVNQRVNLTSFLRRSPGTQLTFTQKNKNQCPFERGLFTIVLIWSPPIIVLRTIIARKQTQLYQIGCHFVHRTASQFSRIRCNFGNFLSNFAVTMKTLDSSRFTVLTWTCTDRKTNTIG